MRASEGGACVLPGAGGGHACFRVQGGMRASGCGGHAWFFRGGACFFGGACMVFSGGRAWFFSGEACVVFLGDMVNERSVCILLECILVEINLG